MIRANQNLMSLTRALRRVCLTGFDDEDLKTLLIHLRPHLAGLSLEQSAHAVAHPDKVALGELNRYLEDLHSLFNFRLFTVPSPDFPKRIPKRLFSLALSRLEFDKQAIQLFYKEGEQDFVLRSESDRRAASNILKRAFTDFTVRPALRAVDFVVPELQLGVRRANPPGAAAWAELISGIGVELTIAMVAVLNSTTIEFKSGSTCWLHLLPTDPLQIVATIPTVQGKPSFTIPYFDTELTYREHIDGPLPAQRLPDGTTASVPCIARRDRDGRLKLRSAIGETNRAAVMAEAVVQQMQSTGQSKEQAILTCFRGGLQ